MQEQHTISGTTEEEIWNQVQNEFGKGIEMLDYHVVLDQNGRRILLDIGINLGSGMESGRAFTTFSAYLYSRHIFRFSIYKEGLIDEIGKIFGMQDVVLGYSDFDEKFVIKTNDEEKVIKIFSDGSLRRILLKYEDVSFGIVDYALEESDGKAPFLELKVNAGITDPLLLREIYSAFYSIIQSVD